MRLHLAISPAWQWVKERTRQILRLAIGGVLVFALGALSQHEFPFSSSSGAPAANLAAYFYNAAKGLTHNTLILVDTLVKETTDIEFTQSPTIVQQQKDVWTVATVLNCLQIVGFPLAALLFLWRILQENNKRRQASRKFELEQYERLQQFYIDFLKLSMDNPKLDFGPWPYATGIPITPQEGYKRAQLGWILITIFEKAYLLRRSMGPKRWRVWQDYMTDYCRSDVFIHIWNWNDAESLSVTNQLDSNFEQFFLSIQKEMPAAQPKSYGYLLEREHRALTGSKPAS